MNILVVCAHPDDEVLGCAGTIAKLTKKGHETHVLILGEGITSRDEKREPKKRRKAITNLRKAARKANAILGARAVITLDFPDNRFDTVGLLDIVKVIEKTKNDVRPNIVFTHHGKDLNIDHRITYNAVLTACRPLAQDCVKQLYSFEIPSSTEWAYPDTFRPNVFFDITGTMENKIKALKAYGTEIKAFPHPRSPEAIRNLAERWGITVGRRFVEAFEAVRIINE